MPLFKKKKEEPKTDDKAKDAKKDVKVEKEPTPPADEEDDDEETDEEGSEYETDSEEDETEATEPVPKKETKPEPKKEEKKAATKVEEESEEEDSEEEETDDEEESGEESEPDETEKTETQTETQMEEETTAAEDVTQTHSAPTDTMADTITQAEDLPSDQDQEEWFEAIDDYDGEEAGDLSIVVGDKLTIVHKQDDGWWEAENQHGERGLVPSTYLKQIEHPSTPSSPTKSGKMLWGSVKKSIKQTSVTDVLHMMGSVPTGFRKEYLKPLMAKYRTSSVLLPKLSASNLFFKDLIYSPALGKVKPRQSAWCRMIQLNEFRNIPLPGKGTKVLKRYVRICLFDGTDICSNIIQLQAACLDKEGKTWTFEQKENEQIQSGKLGYVFIRTEQKNGDIGVLFELSVVFERESSGNETEMICGWAHLPLYEQEGNPTPNKVLEIPVHGGTPVDKGVPLDADVGADEQSNIFRSLLMRNRSPNFSVKVVQPTKEQKELLDCLPDTIIGSAAHISACSYYRQVLGDQLLRDRMDFMSTELISDPFLAKFPDATNDFILMDQLRNTWIEAQKKLTRQQKKDVVTLRNKFIKCFMDKIYPRTCLTSEYLDKERKQDSNPVRTPKYLDPLSMLLSEEARFIPFDCKEVAFNIVNSHCTKAW